jgi:hypothetical protein
VEDEGQMRPEVHLLSSSVVVKFNFEGRLHACAKLPRSRLTGTVVPFASDTALNVIREGQRHTARPLGREIPQVKAERCDATSL